MTAEPSGLADILGELAAALGDVQTTVDGAITGYLHGGRLFAASDGRAVELRLRPDVADAARRTPDTIPSDRGDDWVHFAPPDWRDPLARDRLAAWFGLAWRVAG